MAKRMRDESIFQGVVEFSPKPGTRVRAMNEGATWGIYIQHTDDFGQKSFLRQGTIVRNKSDTPQRIWERYRRQQSNLVK